MTKEERAAYNKAYREAHREKLCIRAKAYRAANFERVRAVARTYNNSPQGKATRSAYKKKMPPAVLRSNDAWNERNPEKRKAQQKFCEAVRRGKVARPSACPKCGGGGVIDGHHFDYSKPLEVEFMCRPCHVKQHREM